jgi:rSAM/selenodomain-associated transferase 2
MTISVIIPTLNEAHRLPALLARLRADAAEIEIIIVDGGSTDGTRDVAATAGARVIASARGRGQQLHAGAAAATGEILWFLHADTTYPTGGLRRIEEVLSRDSTVIGGNFRLLFDGQDRFSRWLDGFYQWIRKHGVYYGDSAVFVRRSAYRDLGGIRPIALMEDFDFNRRMETAGRTSCIADPPLVTSSRRFAGRRPAAIVWGWLKIHLLFYLGVSPDRLARLYNSQRRRGTTDATAVSQSKPA